MELECKWPTEQRRLAMNSYRKGSRNPCRRSGPRNPRPRPKQHCQHPWILGNTLRTVDTGRGCRDLCQIYPASIGSLHHPKHKNRRQYHRKTAIINVYAPVNCAEESEREDFYHQLAAYTQQIRSDVQSVPIAGYFNA